jgi:hypothetical protein
MVAPVNCVGNLQELNESTKAIQRAILSKRIFPKASQIEIAFYQQFETGSTLRSDQMLIPLKSKAQST